MDTETTTKSFRIHESRVFAFKAKVEELQKKAARVNTKTGSNLVFVATEGETETVPRMKRNFNTGKDEATGVVDVYTVFSVSATLPKVKGWVLVAALDRIQTEEGTEVLVRVREGQELPKHYRDHDGSCDHCKAKRQRKTVYMFRKDETKV